VEKKKILIFIDWFLPGYKAGGPVRSMANMVEHLAGEYDFYIITRNADYLSEESYEGVEYDKWVDFISGVKVFYASIAFQNRKTFKRLINETKFDVGYINGIYSWKFSILPLLVLKKSGIKKIIVASRGMLAGSAINVKADKKRIFLKIAKLFNLYSGVVFHVTNEKEAEDVKLAIGGNVKTVSASNLPRKNLITFKTLDKIKGELKLVSLARIAQEKNTLYAIEQLAELKDFNGTVLFDIYGQIYSDDYWQECQEVIKMLPDNIKVNYKGTVDAEEVGRTIQNYNTLFMPTQGENFGHVILESLSAGRPVLISDQTPWRGLESEKAGWDLPLNVPFDSAQGTMPRVFVSVIEEFCAMDGKEFNVWCQGARKLAEEYVSSPELLEGYKRMFDI